MSRGRRVSLIMASLVIIVPNSSNITNSSNSNGINLEASGVTCRWRPRRGRKVGLTIIIGIGNSSSNIINAKISFSTGQWRPRPRRGRTIARRLRPRPGRGRTNGATEATTTTTATASACRKSRPAHPSSPSLPPQSRQPQQPQQQFQQQPQPQQLQHQLPQQLPLQQPQQPRKERPSESRPMISIDSDDDDDDDSVEFVGATAAPAPRGGGGMAAAAAASFRGRNEHMPGWMGRGTINGVANGGGDGRSFASMVASNAAGALSAYHARSGGSEPIGARDPRPPEMPDSGHGLPEIPVQVPPSHTPTWLHILPKDFYSAQRTQPQPSQPAPNPYNPYSSSYPQRRMMTLSLINMWEFTVTIEGLDHYGGSTGRCEAVAGMRAAIKSISKDHVGRDGRKGAEFDRGTNGNNGNGNNSKNGANGGIVPNDPLLRHLTSEEGRHAAGGGGRWRIPLGAYHQLMTYLTSDRNNVVEGIPPEQLRAATLGRETAKKDFASAADLVERGVAPGVSEALAPYQRGGVEFVLDREGRALLADEMGLGKTVQAIAAMSAYRKDWPLLVLCPSTARYHWEAELRCWLGTESRKAKEGGEAKDDDNGGDDGHPLLRNSQINVLASGRDPLIRRSTDGSSTQVVICSIGLIVNLANNQRILPGQFKAIIVDESHALKSKGTKRTKAVLPLLKAAERCLLLSGTPALAKPGELWPQLSVLGSRARGGGGAGGSDAEGRGGGSSSSSSGIWCDEAEFAKKYVKGKGAEEGGNRARLAELHTLLTSTVMIRRMKADILKNLPAKVREKAYVKIRDDGLRDEFVTYMQALRQGRGVMGKLAREHHNRNLEAANDPRFHEAEEDGPPPKEVLHHLYNLTGRSKISRVTKMLQGWLADSTRGKLCIFAHHLDVLNEIGSGAGLSNAPGSATRYIRIDGSTSPRARQEQILQFQTDPAVRIAMLGMSPAISCCPFHRFANASFATELQFLCQVSLQREWR
ncbi:hypothetical protein ACHAWF_011688 [Thalassiosira exigua]